MTTDKTAVTLRTAVDRFLASARCRKPATRRAYGGALDRIAGHVGADRPLAEVTGDELGEALTVLWATAAPATWNQRRAALGSFLAWCVKNGYPAPALPAGIERQAEQRDETRTIDRAAIERLLTRRDVPLREKTLWRMLYETTARAAEILALDIADLELDALAGGTTPDYRSIARFRRRHLSALGHLFVQALELCQAAGMVKLGQVALDGTKLRANASRRKAMSYARMSEKEKILAQEVSDLLAQAEAIDKAEDARYGKNRRGDELPEELRRRETRLAAIRQAKQALEDEARQRAEADAEAKARDRGEDEDTIAERVAAAGEKAVPKPKAQRNFTDPESKIMKTSDGSFHQCFNAQAVVDAEHQVIVAAEVTDCAADVANLIPMTEQTITNTGQAPDQMLTDAGYCSEDNLNQAAEMTAATGTEFLIATGRTKHDDPIPASPPVGFLAGFVEGFPDLRLRVEDAVGEGDLVAQRVHFEGTHTGNFQGLPPTRRKVTFSGLELNRFVDGRVVEHWFQLDALSLLQQLGLVVVPGPRLLPRILARQVRKLTKRR